jgi:phosphoribosylformylglycinamidine (FGAM) synthase-like enzyme
MSSPKTAVAKPARRAKTAVAERTNAIAGSAELSADAARVAASIERAIAEGRSDMLSPEALQALMAALCRAYAAQVESGDVLPLQQRASVSSTDIMIMASGLLRSANLAVFELGMWQSWTGR